MQLKVQPNRYMSDISSSSEESLGQIEGNVTASSRYDKQTRTRGEKVRRKFCRRMEFFLFEGESCSYDNKSIGDIEVPLRYKHLVKQWVPKELPPIYVDFIVNNRTYRIAPSSTHGLGLFSMDEITIKYNTVTELMDYVRPCYNYNDWMWLVWYMRNMRRYAFTPNYIQLINKDKNKRVTIYIDGMPKSSSNITGFINNTRPGTTNKQLNCIYEGHEENQVVLFAIKKIALGEELLVDYHLNRIETSTNSVQVLMQHLFKKPLLIASYIFFIFNIVLISRKTTLEEFSTLMIFLDNSIGRAKTLFFADFEDLVLVRWDKHHCERICGSP
jgi:hypothetical protein